MPLASTTGDVLLSRAMKKGDVGIFWRRSGLATVVWHILRRPRWEFS